MGNKNQKLHSEEELKKEIQRLSAKTKLREDFIWQIYRNYWEVISGKSKSKKKHKRSPRSPNTLRGSVTLSSPRSNSLGSSLQLSHKQTEKNAAVQGLTPQMFSELLSRYFTFHGDWNGLFNAFDADASGRLSFEELLLSLSIIGQGTYSDKLRLLFKVFDLDCDGSLSTAEQSYLVDTLGKAGLVTEDGLSPKEIVSALDADGDSKISLQDWVHQGAKYDVLGSLLKVVDTSLSPYDEDTRSLSVTSKKKIFGVQLDDVLAREDHANRKVPICVEETISVLRSSGLRVEGIFRVPNVVMMNNFIASYDAGEINVITESRSTKPSDFHAISSVLKSYFRLLPEPLFPSRLYDLFIAAAASTDKEKRLKELQELVGVLRKPSKVLFEYLFSFLLEVVDNSEFNKMNSTNIATVFAPNLFRAEIVDPSQMLKDAPSLNKITEELLLYFGYISKKYSLQEWEDMMKKDHESKHMEQQQKEQEKLEQQEQEKHDKQTEILPETISEKDEGTDQRESIEKNEKPNENKPGSEEPAKGQPGTSTQQDKQTQAGKKPEVVKKIDSSKFGSKLLADQIKIIEPKPQKFPSAPPKQDDLEQLLEHLLNQVDTIHESKIKAIIQNMRHNNVISKEQVAALSLVDFWFLGIPVEMKNTMKSWALQLIQDEIFETNI